MPETKTPQQRRRERRKEVRLIKSDLLHDIETVEKLIKNSTDPLESKAYENLHTIIYGAYCDVVDSEV